MDLSIIIGSILRHGLSALGAYLVASGYLDSDAVGGFVESTVGAVLALGTVGWSIYRTKKLKK